MNCNSANDRIRVRMFGPHLDATSGISAVVRNWQSAGFGDRVNLTYVSTLDSYVPGQYFRKLRDAIRSYINCIYMNRRNTDIVHVHMSSGMSFYRKLFILLWARFKGIPAIIHLHGSEFRQFYEDGPAWQQSLIRYFFENSTVVITLSESWSKFVGEIAPAAKPIILYNSAPIALYAGRRKDGESINILCMGRLGERKGTHDLINAFARIAEHCPCARLVLGGDGDIAKYKGMVTKLNLDNRIEIRGWIGSDQKIRTFLDSDIYVLPSYNEGLPGSILEAMAAGNPIVSTPIGGIPEAVLERENGFLVAPGDVAALADRLKLLCEDSVMRKRMGEKSRQIIGDKFESGRIVDRLLGVYAELAVG